tara:strand:+ start:5907 stop:6668 length:762 start_codon:yes stop_codon:yes gene_type:complete
MITLLNGETYLKEEIIGMAHSDDFYYGHLGQHALSSSSLKTLLKSPKTYRNVLKYGSTDTPALIQGKLLHWMVLEPHKIDKLNIIEATTKNTKAYKEAKEKHQEVYLRKEINDAERLTDALLRNEEVLKLLSKAEFEVPQIAMLEGLPFRAKADILRDDMIVDLKSSQDLSSFRFSANKFGYDLQAYLYLKMFNKKKCTFIVVDKSSTDIGIFETSNEFIESGKHKFLQAVGIYKHFFQNENDLDQYVLRGIL